MGQGLHTKMRRVAALEFGIAESKIKVNATNTSKVPNTSATAASSGTDLNGMAIKNAAEKLKKRLSQFFLNYFNLEESELVLFKDNRVYVEENLRAQISFTELIQKAYLGQVSLSATGFYKTPDIHYDKEKGRGKPFHYFAYGMSVSEVEINVLTGETKVIRVDVLHDAGKSLHEEIDIGQVEGAFVQGMGWLLNEELRYDDKGKLLADSPSTYKIPAFSDIPEIFNVHLLNGAPNPNTIKQSKAVGEPPFMLATSVWLAVKDAISAVGNHKVEPKLYVPATSEAVLFAINY
jgi:xanthine dehydrogenase molybdopterin-binding subunit B